MEPTTVPLSGRRAQAAQAAQNDQAILEAARAVFVADPSAPISAVRPSFVSPQPIRQLRDLTRYRKALIHERTRESQRLAKVLEDAGIKLACVAS